MLPTNKETPLPESPKKSPEPQKILEVETKKEASIIGDERHMGSTTSRAF